MLVFTPIQLLFGVVFLMVINIQTTFCTDGYSTFEELKTGSIEELKIQNTDCQLSGEKGDQDCMTTFTKQSGNCPFSPVIAQLFSSIDLKVMSRKFVNPEKFLLEKFVVNTCKEKETIQFKLKTFESYDVIPKYIVLAADAKFEIGWSTGVELSELKLEDIKIVIDGVTSIGNNHDVLIKVEKQKKRDDYEITCTVGSLSVREFLAKFEIDASDMKPMSASDKSAGVFGEEMTVERQALGIHTLNFQNPTIKGMFSPTAGFELTVNGKSSAPKLLNEAKAVYLIIQDFKKVDADIPADAEVFDIPAAALFCSYEVSDTVSGILYSLTTEMLPPDMALIENVKNVAITVATKTIKFINTPELRTLVKDFVPERGFEMINTGINVLHSTAPGTVVAKDEDQSKLERVPLRITISSNKIAWTAPQIIQSTIQQVAAMVWRENKGINDFPLNAATKVVYDSIYYWRKTKSLNVKFNLTERVDVVDGGIVSLFNTTLRLYSTKNNNGHYGDWKLAGSGEETILDELVDIQLKEMENDGLIVEANSAVIFSMAVIRNLTHATYLPNDYVDIFSNSLNFAITDVGFQASFNEKEILRFTGKVIMAKNTIVEILYAASADDPMLKVGILSKDYWLHETVNWLYEKEFMTITWMKFDDVGIIYKKGGVNGKFTNEMMQKADGVTESGIAMFANGLHLDNCTDAKLCMFLNKRFGNRLDVYYKGPATPNKLELKVRIKDFVTIGKGVDLTDITTRISSRDDKGDKVALGGNVVFRRTGEKFPGNIYDDGSGKLMLRAGNHKQGSHDMFTVPYVEMKPVDIEFEISPGYVDIMEYKSRLRIGIPRYFKMEFSGGISRQYVGLKDPNYIRFFATRKNSPLRIIFDAFGKQEPQSSLIKGAKFDKTHVVAYNSMDKGWKIDEVDTVIKKGFYIIGTLLLNSGQKFPAKMKLTDTMKFVTRIMLPPTVLGKIVTKEVENNVGPEVEREEKISHANVSLLMYFSEASRDRGPVLIVEEQDPWNRRQRLEGYMTTIGLEGQFAMQLEMTYEKELVGTTELEGLIFKEVQGKIKLSCDGSGFPAQAIDKEKIVGRRQETSKDARKDRSAISSSWVMNTHYHLDITDISGETVGKDLKTAIDKLSVDVEVATSKAANERQDIEQLLNDYTTQQADYEKDMEFIEKKIRKSEQNIDAAVLDLSTDCVLKCKTVTIPDVEYKEGCLMSANVNIPCLQWVESKSKAVNVNCLIKCEAKKIASSSAAYGDLKNIRILLNRYKELKTLADNLQPMVSLLQKGADIAQDTQSMIADNTDLKSELVALREKSEDELVTINKLSVDSPIEKLHPPCLPFDLHFIIHTRPRREKQVKRSICFNGEFLKNLGAQLFRSTFPNVDAMYKVFEEAEMRYVKLDGIKKSLKRIEKEMNEESVSKRSSILYGGSSDGPGSVQDAIEASLLKTAKRTLPRFTVKSDHTTMGFVHYSPWAVMSRSNPFALINLPAQAVNYQPKKLNGSSCYKARHAIGHYGDIIQGLRSVSDNYQRGKVIYYKSRDRMYGELKDSYDELMKIVNSTNIRPEELKDMFYWYHYTQAGMKDWLRSLSNRLVLQNKRGISLWTSEMKGLYGESTYFDKLTQRANDAYGRSNIGQKAKNASSNHLHGIRNGIKELMQSPKLTLDEVKPMLDRLNSNIESLKKSSITCY